MNKKTSRTLILIWLGWFTVLYLFQWLATVRFSIQRPDLAVSWSHWLTGPDSEARSVYLQEPFLHNQVAWDAEYYLGIAVGGYDDPRGGRQTNPRTDVATPRNYSFFPLYPYLMRALAYPLAVFHLNPVATAALAGVSLSLGGTLAAMFALYDLTRDYFDEASRLRAVFYFLIFPSGFFLAQVYTEGLFVGLAFGSLALMKRRQWFWASLLALGAAWTRAQGAALALPLAVTWLMAANWRNFRATVSWAWLWQGLCALLPLAAYLVWRHSPLGEGWAELQRFYFGRGLLSLRNSVGSWLGGALYARQCRPGAIYFGIEIGAVLISFVAGLGLLRRDLRVALFSLAVVVLSVFSGSAQSMARYVLIAPATFVALGSLGRRPAFDRAWTLASLLLMAMSAALFTFKFWVG